MMLAQFDTNPANREKMKGGLTAYSIWSNHEFDFLNFSDDQAAEKLVGYASGMHLALISLDQKNGFEIGSALYRAN